jgi:hypothetical protein
MAAVNVRFTPKAPGSTRDREITCLSCGSALHSRDGRFVLKYFLIERPKAALASLQRAYHLIRPCRAWAAFNAKPNAA